MKLKYAHLHLRKWILTRSWPLIAELYSVPDLPFEIAWTEERPKTPNPGDAAKIYAKFRHSGKVWVIYDKEERYTNVI